jgi:hypothetical protein
MQKLFYIFLLLLGGYCIAQNHIVIVKGTVLATQNNEPIENAVISLKLPGGISFSQQTDSAGRYKFNFEIEGTSSCTVSAATTKHTHSSTFKVGFLASKDTGRSELHKDTVFIKDFALVPVSCGLGTLPAIVFNTNSIISCNDSLNKIDSTRYDSFDNAIRFLLSVLKDDPEIVIKMQGHASMIEENDEYLALYRAQLTRELLIAKGINGKRIYVKGWGNRKLLVTDNQIKKASTKQEKKALHIKNQRVVFRVISWDFVEKPEEEVPDIEGK